MRKIKEVLRLKWANNLSERKVARCCGIGRPTVKKYLLKAEHISHRLLACLYIFPASQEIYC